MRPEVILAVLIGTGILSLAAVILFPRLRVWLAVQLCRETACLLVRIGPAAVMHDTALDLAKYVQHSGGLQDPKRIKAYRVIVTATTGIAALAQQLIAGPLPKPREETPDADEKKAS